MAKNAAQSKVPLTISLVVKEKNAQRTALLSIISHFYEVLFNISYYIGLVKSYA
jgi:hypothetical protein